MDGQTELRWLRRAKAVAAFACKKCTLIKNQSQNKTKDQEQKYKTKTETILVLRLQSQTAKTGCQ